jgi:hypothetical protein
MRRSVQEIIAMIVQYLEKEGYHRSMMASCTRG